MVYVRRPLSRKIPVSTFKPPLYGTGFDVDRFAVDDESGITKRTRGRGNMHVTILRAGPYTRAAHDRPTPNSRSMPDSPILPTM